MRAPRSQSLRVERGVVALLACGIACGFPRPADVADDGAPVDATPFGEQIVYVKASNTGTSDLFGHAVAISADGSTLAIGAIGEASAATGIGGNQDDDAAAKSGAVYIFVREDGGWRQQAYVKASNSEPGDQFGASLALSDDGNTLAVGAPAEDSNADGIGGNQNENTALDAGAVYVFARNGAAWTQQAYVKASGSEAGDSFGVDVALSGSGDTLVVGAENERSNATGIDGDQTDNSLLSAGAVYAFTRTGISWSQQAYIKSSQTASGARFGLAVALSADGNTLAVSEPNADNMGAGYIYTRAGTAWAFDTRVTAAVRGFMDNYGFDVALSGDGTLLAVGATFEDSAATGIDGSANDDSAMNAGAAYVHARANGWAQQTFVKASNAEAEDNFGFALAFSADGAHLFVGAFDASTAIGLDGDQNDNQATASGAVYAFARSGTSWVQRHYIKATNTGAQDRFGASLDVSANGAVLVVGAQQEDSSATGVGGAQGDDTADNAGAAYVYE